MQLAVEVRPLDATSSAHADGVHHVLPEVLCM